MSTCGIRVLFLTKYGRTGASSRYRSFQYIPYLEQAGFNCQVSALFDADYLERIYENNRSSLFDVLQALLSRLSILSSVRRFDFVVIEYELLPYFPALLEKCLSWMGIPYVVDYDDALFHQYDQHESWWMRHLLGGKIAQVMRGANLVTTGNTYLAEYAGRAGAARVEIIPTVVDLDRYPPCETDRPANATFTIGWIGSPSTAKYLQAVAPALAEVCAGGNGCVRLIGSGSIDLPGVPVEVLPWDEATEVSLLQQLDVGIMPLPDEPWARGKCGFKLIQFMACGVPVVASPVGINCDIVQQGQNGYLASTSEEWVQALRQLLLDAGLRQRMGQAGRKKVEASYSLQVTRPRLAALLLSVVRNS